MSDLTRAIRRECLGPKRELAMLGGHMHYVIRQNLQRLETTERLRAEGII